MYCCSDTINHGEWQKSIIKDDVEVYHKRDEKNFAGHDKTYFKRLCNIEVLLVSYLRMVLPPCKTLGKRVNCMFGLKTIMASW